MSNRRFLSATGTQSKEVEITNYFDVSPNVEKNEVRKLKASKNLKQVLDFSDKAQTDSKAIFKKQM